MLRPTNLLPLFTFIFLSCCSINGVVSDPQTNLLKTRCNPYDRFVVTNISIFSENLNATLQHIREQISVQNKFFATAAKDANGENPVYTLFQCRNYLSIADCVACFDVAAGETRSCTATMASAALVVYDGCFMRYNSNGFFDEAPQPSNIVSCGNQTTGEATAFTTTVRQVLMNLQKATPRIPRFSAATKIHVPNNKGATLYAFAQCVDTVTVKECLDCLKVEYSSVEICLPNSDGTAFDYGCFMRYSTTSFFADNQTIDITPLIKQGSSNKGPTIGGVVGGIALVLVLLGLFAWIRRPKKKERIPREGIIGASMLKGPITYSYNDLMSATNNYSEENKLGEGGFGAVYKDGKVVAVKKLTLNHSKRMEEDFESEVKLISNVHHRNLVRLLGCSSKGHDRILVYEYMKNSSLDRFLFGERRGFLNWKQRYDVILGIARGLTYLHEEFHVRIIHRDVKTYNILLDDDLQPKIADFGLAKLLPNDISHLSTKIVGTLGYTAPEYAIYGHLSEKADIYSYGVVILEIISGQNCKELELNGDDEGIFLIKKAWKLYEKEKHLELVDKALDPNEYDAEEVKKIIEIGLLCIQASADVRPTMSEVVALLQNMDLLENLRPTMPILIEIN
ncbi:cysteine-rich receptor-like protein kinase 2 isoform X2 [Prosopis cineraria]|uniref:cysteine-rich receptor-like protein kinase 2 isoform X2 n=1 Tax=Prosopis cineraria TaxID=364024 RepID=UPI00240EC533|nr:cysteine-rich receptor-like protein kinase 2 isoform X2 [Prosopis cineraria]